MNPSVYLPLAASDGVGIELVVWLVAAAFWVVGQIATAKRKKERQRQREAPTGTTSPSGVGSSPAPDELAEIFRRLGAEIPSTPPPPPAPNVAPAAPYPAANPAVPTASPRKPTIRRKQKPAARVSPEIAQRLANAKRDAEEASRFETAVSSRPTPDGEGIDKRADDHQSTSTATRTSGLVLPRLHSMGLSLSPWPEIPMPGADRTHHEARPFQVRLRSRRELRDAIVAQTLLHPPKGNDRF